MKLVKYILDFIFPPTSIISDRRLPENNSNMYIDDDETDSLEQVCEEDIQDLEAKLISDYSFSCFAFRENDDFSKIIYQLKYGGMKNLGKYFGNLTGIRLMEYLSANNLNDFDLIVPVPLYRTKLRERGYNQSDYICKGIAEQTGIDFCHDFVKRVRHTSTQTRLSKHDRMLNIKDAFEINGKYKCEVYGLKIILVDDVVTTGSTMNEVIKVLKERGCSEVLACSVAMAR